ncbi:hypothetical protein ACWEF6_10600 [Amycolatopsis sp. NPDC004772]
MADSTLLAHLVADATEEGIQQFVVGAAVRSQDEILLLHRPSDKAARSNPARISTRRFAGR